MKMSAFGSGRRCGVLQTAALCLLALFPAAARAACITNNAQVVLDLSRWTVAQIGRPENLGGLSQGSAQWLISDGGTVATQTRNADASVLLSPFELNRDRIEGRWLVNTNYDDDFIGFVFGYQDDSHFYVFDWKQAAQVYFGTDYYADVGMSVKRFHSEEPLGFADLFVATNDPPRVRLLYHNALPYEDWTEYGFSLQAEPGTFTITVTEGTQELARITIQDTHYTGGRFGFYNFSQDQVRYSGFTRSSLPVPPAIRLGPAATVEGRTGTTLLNFPVELAGDNCDGVTVDYYLRPGTAAEGDDYPPLASGRVTFPPGVTNLTLSVPVQGDCEPEADEWLWLVLTNAVHGVLDIAEAAGVILNDDPGLPPSVRLEPVGGCLLLPGDLLLRAEAADPDGTVARVEFWSAEGVRLGVATAPPYAVTWASVPAGRHGLTAVAWDDCGLSRTSAVRVVEVQPLPGLTVNDQRVVEGSAGGVAIFTVALTHPSCQEVRLAVRTSNGTAQAVSDYQAVLETLVFQPGETSAIVTVPIVGDEREEPEEFFFLCLTEVSGAVLLRPQGVGTILDDDTNRAPVVALSLPESCLQLPADLPLSVAATDPDGDITRVEYYQADRLLGFSVDPPYAWSWRDVPSGLHVLRAVACDDQGARATSAPVTFTASWPSSLAVEDQTVIEGDGGVLAAFTLRLVPASCRPVEVSVHLADGSARSGADYLSSARTVSFAPGQTTAVVEVPVVGDRVQESDETFRICLTNAVGAVLGRACGTGTILDDDVNPPQVEWQPLEPCLAAGTNLRLAAVASDPDGQVTQVEFFERTNLLGRTLAAPHVLIWSNLPAGTFALRAVASDDFGSRATSSAAVVTATLPSALSITDCTVIEGNSRSDALFTVSLIPISCRTVQVSVVTADRTALAESDYLPVSVTLTFLPGQSTATVTVPILGDAVEEPDETFELCLVNPVGAVLSRACGLGTILNDDTNRAPSVSWGSVEPCLLLPASLPLQAAVADPDGVVVGVWFYREGTNLLGRATVPPHALVWSNVPPGVHALTAVAEDDLGARTTSAVAVVTATPPSWLAIDDPIVLEGQGGVSAVFSVTLTPATCRAVSVDVVAVEGTARAGADFEPVTVRVHLAPGQTSAVVAVPIVGDRVQEPDEQFTLWLTNVTGAVLARPRGSGTIVNDDTNAPLVRLEAPDPCVTLPTEVLLTAVAEDWDGAIGGVEFLWGGTNRLGVDFVPPYELLWSNVPAGDHVVRARAWDDFGLITLSEPAVIRAWPASLLSIEDRTVVEGSSESTVFFTVSLQPAACRTVAVDVLTADGTARAGEDYRPLGVRVSFAPGQTSVVVGVTVLGDLLEEADEHFHLCLTNASGALVSRSCGRGTILDDDTNQPPVVAITSPADGSVFSIPPGYVAVQAAAADADGVVTQVQFYVNGDLAGTRQSGPYAVLLSGLAEGGYTLVATAVDDRGAWATSGPVRITLRGCDPGLALAPLADQLKCVCEEVVFTAEVTSADPVTLQWYVNGTALPGETNRVLRRWNLKSQDAGVYAVEARSACAVATRSATLSLQGQGNANPVTFTNAGRITIFDNNVAGPYPSALPVYCVPGPIKHLWVTLRGLSHNYPDDMDILLAGPAATGGVAPAVRLLSDAGGGDNVTNLVLTFTDIVTNRLPNSSVLTSGIYAPTDYETPLDPFPLPAPWPVTTTNFSPFLGQGANGTWGLFIRDDLGGDGGSIGQGWTVTVEWEDTPPRLQAPVRWPDGRFEFVLTGLPRMTHVVEASEDMVRWRPVSTNVLSGPTRIVLPSEPGSGSQQFFRAVRCP